MFCLWALALAALGVRLGHLAESDPARVSRSMARQQTRYIPQPARPGSILARSRSGMVLLAGSRQSPSCYVDPSLLDKGRIGPASLRVARAIGLSALEVQERIVLRLQRRFARLKRDLSPQEVRAVRDLRMAPLGVLHEWRRHYPSGNLAATVLGFCHKDGEPGGGLEMTQRRFLSAEDGRRVVLSDAARRPIWPDPSRSRAPRDGHHVLLHLDAIIQGYLQDAVSAAVEKFDAKWGTGVVVDPQTGAVLAMCSAPTFHPEAFNRVPAERRTERAVSVPYEPGSALKPIFAAAAVDSGRLSYRSTLFCENGLYAARKGGRIRDHHGYGTLSLVDVVVRSSNIGMAKVGEAMGNARLHAIARRFGFGRRTGIELPAESKGIVRPLHKWDGYSLRRVPFGQEISATSLQLTMAFCALANGGRLLRPRLVDCAFDSTGRIVWRSRPTVIRRVLSARTAAQSLAVLRQVVERGTGKKCRLESWTSFGKTGTAQIPGPGGYVDGAYAGTFVGGAPAKNPRVVCLVTLYWPDRAKGYYGGIVAAPAVKEVLHKTLVYLDVPPDRAPAQIAAYRQP